MFGPSWQLSAGSFVLFLFYIYIFFFFQVAAKILVEDGPAGPQICKIAKREGATFVVTGSRGAGTVRRTILGSVSDYVLHHAHVPVVVVPKEKKTHSPNVSTVAEKKQ